VSLYRLAQLNIARMKEPLDSPFMADFVANLDRINTLAEQAPGFVWRLKDETGSATAIRAFGDDTIVNMSMWRDVESLSNYAFKTAHVEVMRRRREWFKQMTDAYAVLWWVEKDHRPSTTEAKERLEYLRKHGATPHAFNFKNAFPSPDAHNTAQLFIPNDECPAT